MVINGFGYLVEPNNQFVRRNGSTIVAGIVRVYYAGTDDVAKTYSDFNGTRNPANIRLDNNGRAIIIADVTKAYRVEVRDSNGGLLWTVEPAYCIGGSGGEQLTAALPIRIVDGVITNNGTGLNVFGDNSWSEGVGIDEYQAAEVVGNIFLDSVIELDYVGSLRAGDIVMIGDSVQAISEVRYGSNTIVVAPGVHVSGGEKVYVCGGSLGEASHTEGRATKATGKYAHAEGYRSKAFGYYSHAEGKDTRAYSDCAHAEGDSVVAQGPSSHAEGDGSTDYMEVAQDCTESAEVEVSYIGSDVVVGARANIGNDIYSIVAIDEDTPSITLSSNVTLHAGDIIYVMTGAFGAYSHAEGDATVSAGTGSHSEGSNTAALEVGAHAEGRETRASNYSAHAEGDGCIASGINAHAEGDESVASNYCAHAEGSSESSGYYSHAEGDRSVASNHGSHAEGNGTLADGYGAHAEGQDSVSMHYGSHAEGFGTFATGYGAHSEGYGEVVDTYNVVDDDGGYERSSVRLDSTYGIRVGDLICFDYQWPASTNDWFAVTYVDTDTKTIDIDGYTSALNGDSVYIARGVASGDGAHAEGKYCVAVGHGAHAEGDGCLASGKSAHAEGEHTISLSYGSHSEGEGTIADGYGAHAEGKGSDVDTYHVVNDPYSGTERYTVVLDAVYGIADGDFVCFGYSYTPSENVWHKVTYVDVDNNAIEISGYTTAENGDSVFKKKGVASGDGAHSEGIGCTAVGYGAHAGGYESVARGNYAFAQGYISKVSADYGVAIGEYCTTYGSGGVAIGNNVHAYADNSLAVGFNSSVYERAENSSAVGFSAYASGAYSLAAGNASETFAYASTALGEAAETYGSSSLAINKGRTFGYSSVCIGPSGNYTSSTYATADTYEDNIIYVDDTSGISAGNIIVVIGIDYTKAYKVNYVAADHVVIDGYADVAEYDDIYVYNTGSIGNYSLHIGRNNSAIGEFSTCIGEGLKQSKDYGTAIGKYNVDDNAIFVVGNGTDENSHADCFKIDANGKLMFMHNGNLTDLSTLLNTHNIT